MKKLSALPLFMFGLLCTTQAQKTSPAPVSGATGRAAPPMPVLTDVRLNGIGSCRIHFNATGVVDRAEITRSSGSSVLDNHLIATARKHWHGRPNATMSVPVKYVNVPVLAQTGGVLEYDTPLPAYPEWARDYGMQGRTVLQVIFDEHGAPVYAGVLKSSSCKPLDDYTVKFVLSHWKSSGGEESMVTLPVSYVIVKKVSDGTDFANDPTHTTATASGAY